MCMYLLLLGSLIVFLSSDVHPVAVVVVDNFDEMDQAGVSLAAIVVVVDGVLLDFDVMSSAIAVGTLASVVVALKHHF